MRLSADSVITHWSAGAVDLYGWADTDALGQHVSVLLGAGLGHDIAQRAARLTDAVAPPFEALGVTRDGTRFTVQIDLVLLRDRDGVVVGTQFRHRNVRFARRQEAVRVVGGPERRASFDDSPVAQSRADLEGRVLAVNAALERMLGESAAALLGRNALEMYVAEDRPGLERALARLASGAENYVQHEPRLRRPDGRLVRVVRTVTTMLDEHGAKMLAISLQDVTALRAAEERIHLEAGRFDALLSSLPVTVFTYDL
ncbi:MAG: PAS domain S-box protein, partial [Actinomycetota bacterium]|nr:PAS domain S-box protein [Actinomycetota bacterium]